MSRPHYERIIERYLELFPSEHASVDQLKAFLASIQDADARINRRNFTGHLTASCLLVDPIKQQVLLFPNPRHNHMLLQPGGHFRSADESPIDVATRNLFAETPFGREDVKYLPYDYEPLVPIDLDTHHIGERSSISERRHVHHDLRYVFLSVAGEGERVIRAESQHRTAEYTYVWYDFADLGRMTTFIRLFAKLQAFLSRDHARRRFYVALASEMPPLNEVNTIVVSHILPDSYDFLEAIRRTTTLLGVIPKPKSINTSALSRLQNAGFPIREVSREDITNELSALIVVPTRPTVLLDIGGWFVPAILHTSREDLNIAGIVEDTRNGLTKYEQLARTHPFPFPVLSVAESALKANEDFQVGRSIVFSADAVLRECGLILEYLDAGVVGYGKVGRSIAHHLQLRGMRPYIVEREPLRRLEAFRDLFAVRHRDWVSRNVDVLFCATGSRATDIIDFRTLKSGAYVFSVTSLDDEFDLALLPNEYVREVITKYVDRYTGPHNYFYLVNSGNAVNFVHDAVLGEFIQLVKGGLYVGMRNLADRKLSRRMYSDAEAARRGPGFSQLFELTSDADGGDNDQAAIANLWTETVLLGVKLDA